MEGVEGKEKKERDGREGGETYQVTCAQWACDTCQNSSSHVLLGSLPGQADLATRQNPHNFSVKFIII